MDERIKKMWNMFTIEYYFIMMKKEILSFVTTWMDHESIAAAAAAKSLQLSPTLCNPIDGSPQGSPVPGILQARTLEWVAISFSNMRALCWVK